MSNKSSFTSFFDSLSDLRTRYGFEEELQDKLLEEKYFNSFRGKDNYRGTVLQVSDTEPTQTKAKSGNYTAMKIRVEGIHDNFLPDPAEYSGEMRQQVVDMHPTAFSSNMSFENNFTVGTGVECFYEVQGPESGGTQRGLRFRDHIMKQKAGNHDYNYLNKDAFSSLKSFAAGANKTKVLLDKRKASAQYHAPVSNKTTVPGKMDEADIIRAGSCENFQMKGKNVWCRDDKTYNKNLSQFIRIEFDANNNWRSALPPKSVDFFKILKYHQRIERVVTLNHSGPSLSSHITSAGLEHLDVHLTKYGPKDADWDLIKQFLEKGNTLIHCSHGADRTGAIAGRWAVEKYGQPAEPTLTKMEGYGFKDRNFKGYPDKNGEYTNPDPNRYLRQWLLFRNSYGKGLDESGAVKDATAKYRGIR